MFWKSFPIGVPSTEYIAPYANIYRGMAVLGTQVQINLTSNFAFLNMLWIWMQLATNLDITDGMSSNSIIVTVFVPVARPSYNLEVHLLSGKLAYMNS